MAAIDVDYSSSSKSEILTEEQWTTLLAIADAFIPSTTSEALASVALPKTLRDQNADLVSTYLQESASSIPEFKQGLEMMLSLYVHEATRDGVRTMLSLLQ